MPSAAADKGMIGWVPKFALQNHGYAKYGRAKFICQNVGKNIGCQNEMAKSLAIDWFDAKIQVPGKRIGTNSQNVGHVNVASLNHVNFLKIN